MSVNVFRLLFFHIQFWIVFSVDTESLFKLSSVISNIYLTGNAAVEFLHKVGSFTVEIRFQDKCMVSIFELKELTL